MLRFSLDGPVGPSGEVLPLLSIPAAVLPSAEGAGSSGCAAWCAPKQSAAPPDVADGTLPSEYAEFTQKCSRVHATCVREMTLPTGTTTTETATPGLCVYALESPGYLGIAGKVWDSMYVLLQYLSQHTDKLVRDKRIVELGCGTGLAGTSRIPLLVSTTVVIRLRSGVDVAGISLCSLGPLSVTLTDMSEVIPLVSANVLLNSIMVADPAIQAVLGERYRAAAYCWGGTLELPTDGSASAPTPAVHVRRPSTTGEEDLNPAEHSTQEPAMAQDFVPVQPPPEPLETEPTTNKVPYFDVILASDVVYYPEGYAPLLATLCDLLCASDDARGTPAASEAAGRGASAAPGPVCILAHRHRHPEDKRFFDALFAAPELRAEKLPFRVQPEGEASGVQALSDVILFEITRRQ
jgi:predicted nicotinamide N-methyase